MPFTKLWGLLLKICRSIKTYVCIENDPGINSENHDYQDVQYSPVKPKMSGTSVLHKLKVITWKNLIIRKRHWLLSIFEIAIPVVLFMLVSYARLKIDGMGNRYVNESTYNPQRSSQEFYNAMIDHEVKLYYTPKTTFTIDLIRNVQLKLNLNSAAIKHFDNEDELIAYYQRFSTNETVMGIVFNGIEGDDVPKHLDYSIRPYREYVHWSTDSLYTNALQYVPENGSPNYIYKGFISIQLALDTSFIEMTTKKFPYILTLQEFPYPPHLDDIGVTDIFLYVLPIVTVFSFVFLSPAIIKRIVEEKSTGIKELMKMMGLKSWMLWLGWFLHAFIVNIVSVLIITFLLKVPLWGAQFSAIHYCNWSVFTVFLILYCAAGITYCFAISSLFNRPTLAVVVGSLTWMLTQTIPSGIVESHPSMRWWKKIWFALFPNMALTYGYQAISVYESREVGANWGNLFQSASGGKEDVTLGNVFVMFLIDMVVYMLIAVYFENVRPGPYGLSKPFHFPFTFLFKQIKKRTSGQIECNSESSSEDYCKIEPATNLKVGIRIQKLYKKFGTQFAVNGLSINIYEGQITALLGHNGAGKTTTMSIITGMIAASSGNVVINGADINHEMNKIHGSLGLCPQHNLQFTDLTVIEHLIFFGMLKGLTREKSREESEKLLARLNLKIKKDSLASKLSGGMRRKLSLGISLIGNSKVLILDEPTSGLDPEARREIWDILLSLRGSRTIIITTHFMEEADVLGDRIAIMDHGRLICYGTSMYLKNEYGTGYHLTLIRDEAAFQRHQEMGLNQVDEITKIVKSKIGSAVLQSVNGNHMTYLLPHDMKKYFGILLLELEMQKTQLCITNINVSVTTLEEVFLKVGNMVMKQDRPEMPVENSRDSVSVDSRQKLIGKSLYVQQLKSLLRKRCLTTKIKWRIFVIQFCIALAITFLTVYLGDTSNYSTVEVFPQFNMNLNKYGETSVFYGTQTTDEDLTKMQDYYAKLVKAQRGHAVSSDSVSNAIIDKGVENIAYYRQHMVVSAEFNASSDGQTILNAMYSNTALHGAPISLNLLTNAIVKALLGEDYGILTSNNPLPVQANDFAKQVSEMQIAMLWFILFPLGLLFFTGTFLLFPQMEKASNVKQLQFMCGVKSYSYWFTCYFVDLLLYLTLVVAILIVIVLYGLFGSSAFSGTKEIGALLLILLVYGLCTIPYSYLYSYKKTPTGAFSLYLMVSLFASIVLSIVILLLEFSGSKYYENVGRDLKYVFLWFPQLGLAYSSLQFSRKVVSKYNWINEPSESRKAICRYEPNPCCGSLTSDECKTYQSYFEGDNNISLNLAIMFTSTILYFAILLLLETTILHEMFENCKLRIAQMWSNIKSRKSNTGFDVTDSTDVGYSYLNEQNTKDNLLSVKNLKKTYWDQEVVKGVSFGVKPGDCFGLLGVNGAGKTTTFRMLTGDELPTHGDAEIKDFSGDSFKISKDAKKYLEKVGYCPQFDAINEVLTGRQMLKLFAELRGVTDDAVEEEVNACISLLGLQEYADRPCGKYSGGNKRKLSVAIGLIANPMLVMLDEPTSGVDPVSRRKLWNVLTMIQQQDIKPAIVLTSHSMEECEALCNKLTIMKAGRLECFGTIPELKQKYGQGFTIKLKLKIPTLSVVVETMSDETHSNASQTQPLNTTITRASVNLNKDNQTDGFVDSHEVQQLMLDFQDQYLGFCKLCDKHSGLLHYHISDKDKKWSELFKEIEELSQKHPIIEDYHISETTLEEVFLSIARS